MSYINSPPPVEFNYPSGIDYLSNCRHILDTLEGRFTDKKTDVYENMRLITYLLYYSIGQPNSFHETSPYNLADESILTKEQVIKNIDSHIKKLEGHPDYQRPLGTSWGGILPVLLENVQTLLWRNYNVS
jgi:hypothetical protein